MAILHRAYSFNEDFVLALLCSMLTAAEGLDLRPLGEMARRVVAEGRPATRRALADMRYAEDWLDGGEANRRANEWFMIVLARALSPLASLSNRLPGSHLVLRLALPAVGWSPDRVKLLVYGRSLDRLIARVGSPALGQELRGLAPFGGWLSAGDVQTLRREVRATPLSFDQAGLVQLQALADHWQRSPYELWQLAHADAGEMLRTAAAESAAIFMVLD